MAKESKTAKKTTKTEKSTRSTSSAKTNKTTKTDKAAKNNDNKVIAICIAGVLAVIAIIVIVAVMLAGSNKYSDKFFTSDDTKYVLNLEKADLASGDEQTDQYVPVKAHLVYEYSGDEIKGLKIYYEYADSAAAKKAKDYIVENDPGLTAEGEDSEKKESIYKEVIVDGKFVIITAREAEYEGIKASDVKQQIEFYETMKNSKNNQNSTNSSSSTDAANGGTVNAGGSVDANGNANTNTTENK